ncbi:MAG: isopentenyl-diphosphate delta-isomerase [bacterium]|jgi:isopentenyl-diphosphate delta-isomerase
MIEWLDIVDENDIVIGRAPRDQIHAENHFHRSSHVLVFNSQGEVFVQLRSMSKDNSPGLWDTSAAGHVDSGEDYLECAVRELAEELGVSSSPVTLKYVSCLPPGAHNGFEFTRIFTLISDEVLLLQPEEVDDGRWLSPTELEAWIEEDRAIFTDSFLTIWRLVRPLTS